jgi:hypothetical protein
MLWLLQRDFLQGKTVQQLVGEALAPVPNPQHDKDITELNKIRASLSTIASNSTGTGHMTAAGSAVLAMTGRRSSSGGHCRTSSNCMLLMYKQYRVHVYRWCCMRNSWMTAALQNLGFLWPCV